MQYNVFPTSFYWSYQLDNLEELNTYINSKSEIDNSGFTWGEACQVDRIPLKIQECFDFINPAIKNFADSTFNKRVELKLYDPWVNLYSKGFHQEVHDHKNDFGAVIFLNDGPDFSKFYFYNRYNNCVSNAMLDLFDEVINQDIWYPEVKAGTILFFPGTLLHGVTSHNSDIIRKTLSFNMDIMPL